MPVSHMLVEFKLPSGKINNYPAKSRGISPDTSLKSGDIPAARLNRITVSLFNALTTKHSFITEKL